jgi:uncharacterized membrane protein YqgA involved in biofilm formation
MVGTMFNAATVLVGATAGLALGQKIPASAQNAVFTALGLFTLGLGIHMTVSMSDPFAIFLALVVGSIIGHGIRLEERLPGQSDQTGSPGWVRAFVLFCTGAMTVVGCMEDGLDGDPTILLVKGSMDLISSAFLAAALGASVLWAALALFIFQGSLTLLFMTLGPLMSDALITEMGALGGVLLLALALDLLQMRSFKLLNLLPAILILPAMRPLSNWLQLELTQIWHF